MADHVHFLGVYIGASFYQSVLIELVCSTSTALIDQERIEKGL